MFPEAVSLDLLHGLRTLRPTLKSTDNVLAAALLEEKRLDGLQPGIGHVSVKET
jgi:hypothetical protein